MFVGVGVRDGGDSGVSASIRKVIYHAEEKASFNLAPSRIRTRQLMTIRERRLYLILFLKKELFLLRMIFLIIT